MDYDNLLVKKSGGAKQDICSIVQAKSCLAQLNMIDYIAQLTRDSQRGITLQVFLINKCHVGWW
jgi:hypothetical protein